MTSSHGESSHVDGQLTRLLGRWAEARRLDPRQAEAIRLAARRSPAALGFAWWWRLLDPEHGSVFQGDRPLITRSAPTTWSELEPFTMLLPEPVGPLEDGEFVPYLRLT